MRLEDLAARLVAVEAKLANLTGTTVDTTSATSIEELDARLTLVEITVDQLVAVKTQEHVDAIVAAAAQAIESIQAAVAEVVALSPSAEVPAAADIVAEVVQAQAEADAVEHTEVADIVSAAVQAVVAAEPEVVIDPVAITAAIIAAVADAPLPATVGNSIANQNISAPGNDVVWLYQGNMSPLQWEDTLLIKRGYTWSASGADVTSGIVINGDSHDGVYHISVADAGGTAVTPTSGKVYTFVPPQSAPKLAPEVVQQIVDAIAEIIATATGEEVAEEVHAEIAEAVATPADPALDAIEARLNVAEAKVNNLLGK
jgi:hypothetical protein